MSPTVECCLTNVSSEWRALARESDVTLREAPCLDRCGTCRRTPFLVVDGEVRTGESHRAILASVDGVDLDAEGSLGNDGGPGR